MSHDEEIILMFLRSYPDSSFTRKEISRKAVKRTVYEQNPRWADIPLASLVAQGLVEVDQDGYYRLKKRAIIT